MGDDSTGRRIQSSLAMFVGLKHLEAAQTAINLSEIGALVEPLFGSIGVDHVQLVPQNRGIVDELMVSALLDAFPNTQFRLHANVRVTSKHTVADISGFNLHNAWFIQASELSKQLKAPAYTAHSGFRVEATMRQMLDNARAMSDLFECSVGIEGQYPNDKDSLLVSTWSEYREVFESGVPYAIDLSHLNILAHKAGVFEMSMTKEMLANENCIEVHVSQNNGSGDWHQVCDNKPWWYELMASINDRAVIFTEGNHRVRRETIIN
jgi:hypothetical protein